MTTTSILTSVDRQIKFDRITKDYCVTVDGQFIGYTSTYTEGERLADEYVYDLLERGLISDDPRDYDTAAAAPAMDSAADFPTSDAPAIDVLPSAELVAESLRVLSSGASIHGDTTFQRACDKAALHVARGVYPQSSAGDWLLVGSTGSVYRVRTFTGGTLACNCQAGARGRDCWHAALTLALLCAVDAA